MSERDFLTMGIESSCDETSVAIVQGERTLLSNVISSQIEIHKVFGGVVPEIASRHHLENINLVTRLALREASEKLGRAITTDDVDLIGVTCRRTCNRHSGCEGICFCVPKTVNRSASYSGTHLCELS